MTNKWFTNIFNIQNIEQLQELCDKHGVALAPLENDGLLRLNYNQIESSPHSYFASHCRGLVLDANTLEVVARPFYRFFNYHEVFNDKLLPKLLENNHNISFKEKADGSLIKLFYFNGKWRVHTRNSNGTQYVGQRGLRFLFTYEQLAIMGLLGLDLKSQVPNHLTLTEYYQNYNVLYNDYSLKPHKDFVWLDNWNINYLRNELQNFAQVEELDKQKTYLFELCTPLNAPVVDYQDIIMYFLGALDNYRDFNDDINRLELSDKFKQLAVDNKIDEYLELSQKVFNADLQANGETHIHDFKHHKHILQTHTEVEDLDNALKNLKNMNGRNSEGYIIYINRIPKMKLKNESYLLLHYNLSKTEFTNRNFIDIVWKYEDSEILSYMPHLKTNMQPFIETRDLIVNQIHKVVNKIITTIEKERLNTQDFTYHPHINYDKLWKEDNPKWKKQAMKLLEEMNVSKIFIGFITTLMQGKDFEQTWNSTSERKRYEVFDFALEKQSIFN